MAVQADHVLFLAAGIFGVAPTRALTYDLMTRKDYVALANELGVSQYARDVFGVSNQAKAEKLAENLLGSAVSADVKTAATGALKGMLDANGGNVGAAGLEGILFLSRTSDANYTPAWTQLQNRVAVAQAYVDSANPATTFPLTSVTQDTASRDAVIANIKSIADTAPLTIGTDTLVANKFSAGLDYTPGGNDRVNTLQDEDTLVGTGVNPTLNATLGNANDNGATTIHPTLTGVQTVNVAFSGAGAAVNVLDLQDSTGIKSVNITRVAQSNGDVSIDNLTAVTDDLSLNNTSVNTNSVEFSFVAGAVSGAQDATNITLNNANTRNLVIEQNTTAGNAFTGAANNMGVPTEGFETLNMVSSGSANTVGQLWAEDLQTLNISGDKDLTIGSGIAVTNAGIVEATAYNGGFGHVAGSMNKLDASTFTGNLTVNLGNEIDFGVDNTSGSQIAMSVTGGTGNDTFRLTTGANIGATDVVDGGTGNDTLVVTAGATVTAGGTATAQVANVKGVEALEIRTGHDAGAGLDTVTIDADAFDALATIYVRNEGSTGGVVPTSAAEGMVVNLNDLTSEQANAITLAHGTTGNSNVANNVVNIALKTATGTTDTAKVTIVDGVNQNPYFSASITATNIEQVTIDDKDTESNTIDLTMAAAVTSNAAGLLATSVAGSKVTLTGGVAGQYMSLDSFTGAVDAPAGTTPGYGYLTDSVAMGTVAVDSTTALAAASRDTAVSTVFYSAGVAAADRITTENFDASAYVGNVVARFGDLTRANGVSSQDIKTGTGNDTLIFDALGVANSGFTSGDTIAAGTGTDTLVIDGNHTSRINVQKSEWDNTTGVDVLRLAGNAGVAAVGNNAIVAAAAGTYYVEIDNEFVKQTDAGNGLTIISNDGDLTTSSETDLVLNLRPLAQTSNVTFIGANGNGVANNASNRLQTEDNSVNGLMKLDGGDTNTATADNTGNNNVLEVFNNADVSINDLSNTKNFGRIESTNDTAVAQRLNLVLNDTVMDQLVDSNHAAANTAGNVERLVVVANNNVNVANAVANLNIDASAVTNKFGLDVLVGRGTTNTIVGTAGADKVVVLGNYTAAQAVADGHAAVNLFQGANAMTGAGLAANGVNYKGVDGLAGTADDVLLAYNGTFNLGAGDVIEVFGGADLTAATIAAGTTIIAHSSVRLTETQLNSLGNLKFVGNGLHGLQVIDEVGVVGSLGKVSVEGGNAATLNVITNATALTGTVTIPSGNTPVVPLTGQTFANVTPGGDDGGTTNPTNPGAGANVTISGAGTHSATAQADTFKLADNPTASYEVTINGGFLYSADKISVPVGSALPSAVAGGVNNVTDGNVDLTWVDNNQIVTIHLVGVDAATEAGLQANAVSSTVFGTF